MTLSEFANLVAEMREAQQKYYAGERTRSQLTTCKQLESKVGRTEHQMEARDTI